MLADRLGHLTDAGVVELRPYSKRPERYEYALTEKGLEFVDVVMAMVRWGDRWSAGEAGGRLSDLPVDAACLTTARA